MQYDAFISYSTSGDGALAEELQIGLERLVKPWYRRRPFLRIFRDVTSLPPGASLSREIVERLDASGHVVLLVSPESASSQWVELEVAHVLATRGPDNIVPVVTSWTGGAPHDEMSDFDWASTDVPPALRGVFTDPLYVDMRWTREDNDLGLANPRFERNVVEIAAAIRDQGPDEFYGALVGMRTRARILTGTILLAGTMLLGALTLIGVLLLGAFDTLDSIEQTLKDREQELLDAEAALTTAERALAEASRLAEVARADLADATADLIRLQNEVDRTNQELDAAVAAVEEATRALETAEAAKDQALNELAAAEAERDRVLDELATTRAELGDAQIALAITSDARDRAIAERDAIADVEESVALALDSGVVSSNGDAALGLALAAESLLTDGPPPAGAYSALLAARQALATNQWQVSGAPTRPFDAPELATAMAGDVVVDPRSGVLVSRWTGEDGSESVWATAADGASRRVASRAGALSTGTTRFHLGRDGTLLTATQGDGEPIQLTLRDVDGTLIGQSTLPLVPGGIVNGNVGAPTQTIHAVDATRAMVVIQADGETLDYDAATGNWLTISGGGFWVWTPGDASTPPVQVGQAPLFTYRMLAGQTADGRAAWAEFDRVEPLDAPAYLRTTLVLDGVRQAFDDADTQGAPECVQVSPSGDSFALSDSTGFVRFFDVTTGELSDGPTLAAPTDLSSYGPLTRDCGAFTDFVDSGNAVLTVTRDGVVRQWERAGTTETTRNVYRARQSVTAVAFDTNRSQLRLVTDAREMISVDRRASIGLAPAELSRDLESTGAVSVSTDGTLIGVNGYTPRWFSSGAGIPRADDLSLPGNPFGYRLSLGRDYLIAQGSFGFGDYAIARAGGTRTAIDFDVGPDQGLPTAAGGADVLVVVRNQAIHSYSTARLVAGDLAEISAPIPVGADVTGLTISDDGRRVALVADDEARIYDRESGQLLLTAASPDLAVSPSVTIDPSGSLLAVSSQRSISVWDVATRQVVLDATHERELGQVDISADGLLVAADGGRAVWELTSGRRISGVSVEIDSAVGVGFLGATHRLVSVGSRRGQSELMIWDTLDPDAACRLAAPSMQGRSVAPYLRPGRAPSAC